MSWRYSEEDGGEWGNSDDNGMGEWSKEEVISNYTLL